MTLTSSARIPVVIDCDPGADDFFALIWALIMHKKGYIDIVAITTSGGNVAAANTYKNAIRACQMMGVTTLIGKGEDTPGAEHADHIHGKDGIGNASDLLPPVKEVPFHNSLDLLTEMIEKYEGRLELLTIGPVTNLAKIEQKNPGILRKTKRII